MKKTLLFVLALISLELLAQDGYKIDFHIKELKDTTIYLGYYFGESTFRRDTAKSDHDGRFSFSKPKRLERGIYFLILGKNIKAFDPGFIVGQKQHFTLETSTTDYIRNMKVTGDEDNKLFFENMLFNADRHKEAAPYLKILKDSTLTEDQKKEAREGYAKIEKLVQARQEELIAKNPNLITSKLLKINRRVEIPPAPKKADGTIDSAFQFRYYRKHFFDNFDLAEEALIRLPTPTYQEKVNEYLDKLFVQTPDTLMAAIDDLAARVKSNKECYKYLVWNCIYKYQKPAIMGLDEIFVRLYDKYYASGEMDFWITASMKKTVKDHADKLRTSLIGKTAVNLIMQDDQFQKKALYDIKKKYSVLFIFDPDCGHCREETPKLVNFYTRQKDKMNLEVFAVSLDSSMKKMRDYMKEMKMTWVTVNGPRSYVGPLQKHYYAETTPMVYIIDEKKKIIAKGLPVDRIEEFITNYEKFEQRKAAQKAKGT